MTTGIALYLTATDAKFVDPAAPPEPLHPPTGHALELLRGYLETGAFQLR